MDERAGGLAGALRAGGRADNRWHTRMMLRGRAARRLRPPPLATMTQYGHHSQSQATKIDKDHAVAHSNLGVALKADGQVGMG